MSDVMTEGASRRERQILSVLYRRPGATVAEVQEELKDAPGYDGVRTTLRILEKKGFVRHRADGPRYLYFPTEPLEAARKKAIGHLVGTFFGGSTLQAAAALLEMSEGELQDQELDRLRQLVAIQEER